MMLSSSSLFLFLILLAPLLVEPTLAPIGASTTSEEPAGPTPTPPTTLSPIVSTSAPVQPTLDPTESATISSIVLTPTPPVVILPSYSNSNSTCSNRAGFWIINSRMINWCEWVGQKKERCSLKKLRVDCPVTCNACSQAQAPSPSPSPAPLVNLNSTCSDRQGQWILNKTKWCRWAANRGENETEISSRCELMDLYRDCPETCGNCTYVPSTCFDREGQFRINNETRRWCDVAKRRMKTCGELNLYTDCPVSCQVCNQTQTSSPTTYGKGKGKGSSKSPSPTVSSPPTAFGKGSKGKGSSKSPSPTVSSPPTAFGKGSKGKGSSKSPSPTVSSPPTAFGKGSKGKGSSKSPSPTASSPPTTHGKGKGSKKDIFMLDFV